MVFSPMCLLAIYIPSYQDSLLRCSVYFLIGFIEFLTCWYVLVLKPLWDRRLVMRCASTLFIFFLWYNLIFTSSDLSTVAAYVLGFHPRSYILKCFPFIFCNSGIVSSLKLRSLILNGFLFISAMDLILLSYIRLASFPVLLIDKIIFSLNVMWGSFFFLPQKSVGYMHLYSSLGFLFVPLISLSLL